MTSLARFVASFGLSWSKVPLWLDDNDEQWWPLWTCVVWQLMDTVCVLTAVINYFATGWWFTMSKMKKGWLFANICAVHRWHKYEKKKYTDIIPDEVNQQTAWRLRHGPPKKGRHLFGDLRWIPDMPKEYFRFPYHAATSDLIRFLADFLPWIYMNFVIEWLDSIRFNCLSSQGFKCSTPWQVEDMVCFITMEVFTWMLTSLSSETWRRWFNVWKITIWFHMLRKATQVLPPGQKVKWWNIKTIMDQFDSLTGSSPYVKGFQGAGTSSSYG